MPAISTQTSRIVVQSASEIMRRNLITLRLGDDVYEAVARLLKANISGAPVVDDQSNYLGVLSEKCCITALTDTIELASELGLHQVRVSEFMTRSLVTIPGDLCVFDAIDHLLSKRISGAPVTDSSGKFRGIFSEKTAMRVLASAMMEGLPGTNVESYMNVDRNRVIGENDLLLEVAHKFQETPYRRLPVLRDERLVGQVSRRDVLNSELRLASEVFSSAKKHSNPSERMKVLDQPKSVGDVMDDHALTASPSTDLLGITQMFLNSPYRRIPIVDGGKLVGQISRRDLLQAAATKMIPRKESRGAETLYLSGVLQSAPDSLT